MHNCDHTDDAGVACNREISLSLSLSLSLTYYVSSIETAPTNCTEGAVRLTGYRSSSPREGTVEICVNGYWGTICSNGWDSRDARVICSTLGFPSLGLCTHSKYYKHISVASSYTYDVLCAWHYSQYSVFTMHILYQNAGAIPYRYSYFGYGTGPIILDSVNCIGNENNIIQCAHLGVGVTASYCYHFYDVGVECLGEHESK